MRVAVLRCRNLPSFVTWEVPNVEEYFADDRMVVDEFRRVGVEAESVMWGDERLHEGGFDVALLRSTWDYVDHREWFFESLAKIEASPCRLFNPLEPVRWNSDKRYLLDLSRWGVAVIPTYEVAKRTPQAWQELVLREDWPGAVVKPVIGTGGAHVQRIASDGVAHTLERLAAESTAREFFLQPLVPTVMSEGEWSYVYIQGELSHALLKKPASGDYRTHGMYGGTVEVAKPRPDDARQAEAIVKALPFDLLYARLDLVRIGDRLSIMELELIEPILYCQLAPATVSRLVDACLARAR